jgi:hypothetical protein
VQPVAGQNRRPASLRPARSGEGDRLMAELSKWEQCAEALQCVLPKPLCTRRCELLPQVLQEWERNALVEHLSREPRADIRKRIKKLDRVTKLARQLHDALDKLEQVDDVRSSFK